MIKFRLQCFDSIRRAVERWIYHRACDARPVRAGTRGYLPSHRDLPLLPIVISCPAGSRRMSKVN